MINMHKIILAGYGGQGMLLCGQVLAFAAMKDGFNVTWFPSYGPEMRGGAASCSVIISEKKIDSPVVKNADACVAMSQPAFDKYNATIAQGGSMIYNSDIITVNNKRDDIKYIGIDFSLLATGVGNLIVSNMVALGSLNGLFSLVSEPSLNLSLEDKFGVKKAELIGLNKKAIDAGVKAVS